MIKIMFSQAEIDELYKAQLSNPSPRIKEEVNGGIYEEFGYGA